MIPNSRPGACRRLVEVTSLAGEASAATMAASPAMATHVEPRPKAFGSSTLPSRAAVRPLSKEAHMNQKALGIGATCVAIAALAGMAVAEAAPAPTRDGHQLAACARPRFGIIARPRLIRRSRSSTASDGGATRNGDCAADTSSRRPSIVLLSADGPGGPGGPGYVGGTRWSVLDRPLLGCWPSRRVRATTWDRAGATATAAGSPRLSH